MAHFSGNGGKAVKSEGEVPESGWSNEHDNVPLKVRMKTLFATRLPLRLGPSMSHTEIIVKKEDDSCDSEGGSRVLSNPVMEDLIQDCAGKGKAGGLPQHYLELASSWQETESTKSNCFMEIHESDMICSSGKISPGFNSCDPVSAKSDNMTSLTSPTFPKVKAEPSDMNILHCPDLNPVDNLPFNNTLPVKTELRNDDDSSGDELDHMLMRDRMKLLVSGEASDLSISRNYQCLSKIEHSFTDYRTIDPECSKPININRPRKRKRSATDSVQTALDEDAPGLLQVLVDKGILVDEIKLYGGVESDDALDDSLNENSFSELEAVMSKLFSQRQSMLKSAPIRCKTESKVSYCLPCLLSLVEQTRYLRFRKWPVEWGWCRDLQAFIFVFERHNRIVLERPEYGYATYFFELVASLPIDWQIKRLVVAMKLSSCSRITLIENKALLVGEELTEGEARVLTEYGWIPNSGLATMLNYCDRVVHDRQHEREVSEWRSKIGKLLMDGYNGGIILSTHNPQRVTE